MVCMDHDLFIQSQNGTFGCFHLGVILPSEQFLIMDNAVYRNICIHICGHMFSFPLDKYLIGELLNFMVSICLTLKKKKLPNCFPKWPYHFAFPPEINGSAICSTCSAFLTGVIR